MAVADKGLPQELQYPVVLCLTLYGDKDKPHETEFAFREWFEEHFGVPPNKLNYVMRFDTRYGHPMYHVSVVLAAYHPFSYPTDYFTDSWDAFLKRLGLVGADSHERYFDYYTLWVLSND